MPRTCTATPRPSPDSCAAPPLPAASITQSETSTPGWPTNPCSTATAGERSSVEAARRYADAHGWATPDRWTDIDHDLRPHSPRADTDIDQVAISRVLDEQPTQLNHRERRLAAQLLTAQGLSLRDIAARLAINPRTVSRYRRDLADPNDLRKQQAPTLRQLAPQQVHIDTRTDPHQEALMEPT